MQDVLNLIAQAAAQFQAGFQLLSQAQNACTQYTQAQQVGAGSQASGQNVGFQQSQPGFGQPGQYPQGQPQGQPIQPGQYGQAQQAGIAPQQYGGQQQLGGGAGFGTAPQSQVTPDMIQQLITPLVQNEQIKAALTQQMQAMGIQNLPDARPDQLGELYQRFSQVRDQYAGQQGQAQQPAGGTPSII